MADTHYFRLSVSLNDGKPAKSFFLFARVSDKTMRRPPTTLKLRRKKERSKRRPYPRPATHMSFSNERV